MNRIKRNLSMIAAALSMTVLSAAGADTGQFASEESGAASAPAAISGTWSGQYIAVAGRKGRITLEIDADSREVGGRFVLELLSEDRIEYIAGALFGRRNDGELTLRLEADRGGSMSARLRTAAAPVHAEQVLFGTVESATGIDLGLGVLIVWHYGEP